MFEKYFLRKALRASLVNISKNPNAHFSGIYKEFKKIRELLVDLSMSEDEIQRRVGLNTALVADLDNLKVGKASLEVYISSLRAEKATLEQRIEELRIKAVEGTEACEYKPEKQDSNG